jgi:uncharacterized protein
MHVMTSHSPSGIAEAPNMATLRAHRREILDIGERRGVSRVRVFGSVARGDATSGSDIDLLVDFDTSHRGLDLFAFAREVEQLLGHRVEVGTEVHPIIRDKVDAEAVLL